jgi:hypothetical protein
MRRGPSVILAALILGVLIGQVALAGGGSDGATIASLQRRVSANERQIARLQARLGASATAAKKKRKRGPPGPPGPPGPAGAPGALGAQGPAGSAPVCEGNGTGADGKTDEMVAAGAVCIDKFEASVWSSPTGGTEYGVGSDDMPGGCHDTGYGCKGKIFARSVAGVPPTRFITYFQAQQALAAVGKRLPSNAEWQQAAIGTPDQGAFTGGAGPDDGTTSCNTNSAVTTVNTGSRSACVSDWGAYDMVGNLREWVADWVPASATCTSWGSVNTFASDDQMCLVGSSTTATGPGALIRGGSYGDDTDAGSFAVNGLNQPSLSGNNVGFRGAR